jgi:hypothetical protein
MLPSSDFRWERPVHSPGMFAGVRVYHSVPRAHSYGSRPKGRSRAHLIVLLSYMGIMLAEVHRREPVEILVFLPGAIAVGILARRWGLALALGAAATPVVAAWLYLEWRGSTRQALVSDFVQLGWATAFRAIRGWSSSTISRGQRPAAVLQRRGDRIGAAETGFRARMACNPRQPASGGLDEIPCERPF